MMGADVRRSRRELTLVAAGHVGNVQKELASEEPTGVVLKIIDVTELEFYKLITASNESLKKFIPEFGGETMLDGERFLRLQNVSAAFRHPYVMDCKIGTRTFVEKEASNKKPRTDLYKRAEATYGDVLTAEERQEKSITKYRWMSIHDECSTTRSLGFRVDGVAGQERIEKSVLAKMRTRADVVDFFSKDFFPRVTETSLRPELVRRTISQTLLRKLREFRQTVEESEIIKHHEVIGSSLLVVADSDGRCGVSLIDFAKTLPVPDGVHIDHRTPWRLGNHEDGILFGVDTLVSVMDEVHKKFAEECERVLKPRKTKSSSSWCHSFFCMPFFRNGRVDNEEEIKVDNAGPASSSTTAPDRNASRALTSPAPVVRKQELRITSAPREEILARRRKSEPGPAMAARKKLRHSASFTIVGRYRSGRSRGTLDDDEEDGEVVEGGEEATATQQTGCTSPTFTSQSHVDRQTADGRQTDDRQTVDRQTVDDQTVDVDTGPGVVYPTSVTWDPAFIADDAEPRCLDNLESPRHDR